MNIEFNNQHKNYPIVLIPEDICTYLKSEISESQIASELKISKPKKEIIKKPHKPSEYVSQKTTETKFSEANGCMIIIVLLISIGIGATADSFIEGLGLTLLIFALEAIGFWIGGISLIKFKDETKYTQIKRDSNQLKKMNLQYEQEIKKYNSDSEKAQMKYDLKLAEYKEKIEVNKSRIQKKLHKKSLKPLIVASRGKQSLKRGIAELKFLELLDNELKGSIFIDMVPQIDWSENKQTYNPDFTMVCKKTNLHIDIEIDEPYTLKDKKPIHYIDSSDDKRNEFFLDNNWCVIRFSEKQIINETIECIETIKSVYNNIIEMNPSYSTDLKPEPRWTYEESFIMQNNKFRENYLT